MSNKIFAILVIAALTACGSQTTTPAYGPELKLVQTALDTRGVSHVCFAPASSQSGEIALARLGLLHRAIIPPHVISTFYDSYMSAPGRGFVLTDLGSDFAVGSVSEGVPALFCGAHEKVVTVDNLNSSTVNNSQRIQYHYTVEPSVIPYAPAWLADAAVLKAYPRLALAVKHAHEPCEMILNQHNAVVRDTCHSSIGGAAY